MWTVVAFAFLGGYFEFDALCIACFVRSSWLHYDSSGQVDGLVRMRFVAGAVGFLPALASERRTSGTAVWRWSNRLGAFSIKAQFS